jgi:mannose-6-phosphate isomerase-like protein (cupin superfamily)
MAICYQLDQIDERVAPEPYTRFVKVIFNHHTINGSPLSLGFFRLEPGQSGPKHIHQTEVEIYIVLAGKGTVFIGNETVEMTSGSILYVPPLVEHQTYNTGQSDFEFYGVFAPSTDFSEMLLWEKTYK